MAPPDYLRFFPYDGPYPDQADAMAKIHDAIANGRDVLFEGACGTGKTLAALVPALHHARETDKTVVITTNVHQQMRQFIAEARAITREEPIRAVVFRGKASMCHLDVGYEECQVLRDNTRDHVEDRRTTDDSGGPPAPDIGELDVTTDSGRPTPQQNGDGDTGERRRCEHFHTNLTGDVASFQSWLFADVRTPDEVYDHAHERTMCGYELLKAAMDAVDLVVCNYHHVLDPMIREQFFRWLDRDPADVIAVFDEAHNVADAARDHATRTIAELTVEGALAELADRSDPRAADAANVLEAFHVALVETYETAVDAGDIGSVGDDWQDVTVANDHGRDDLTLAFLEQYTGQGFAADLEGAIALGRDLDTRYEEAYRRGETEVRKECPTLAAASFVQSYLTEGTEPGQYPVVSVRRDVTTGDVYGRAELYTCIPREVTEPLLSALGSSVLMSATLRPFDVTREVLGLSDPIPYAAGLSFPQDRRRTFAVDTPALFARNRDDPTVKQTVAGAIADAITYTPGNTLAFFPSYTEAGRYADLVDVDGATIYLDEPGTRADDLRERFTADTKGALFTSLWGTLTEGVSFDGDDARTACVVGVPYPHLDDRTQAVQDAYEAAFGDRDDDAGWRFAVEVPTIRKTRQAIGRVLRSPTDFGARVLLDRRYTAVDMGKYSVRDAFPPEERSELLDVDPGKLKYALHNFYSDLAAWDGAAPNPRRDGTTHPN